MKSKAFILSIFAYFLIAFSSYANMFDWNAKKVVDASTTACNCNQGLADLVEELIPAVVNISSEQIIKQENNSRTRVPSMPGNNFLMILESFLSILISFLWIGALVLTKRWCCLVLGLL